MSELFLGAMTFDGPDELRQMLKLYADADGNVIDTASAYGDSEEVVGSLLEGRRDRFVVATKYTLSRDRDDPNAAGNHRTNLTRSPEASLRRLRTDYLDLMWVHVWDRHTPVEETMRALDDAVRAGKILYVGISDAPAWIVSRANTLAEWRDRTPFAGVQVPYSLLRRDIERELLPMAEAMRMTAAVLGPLGERDHAAARAVLEVAEQLGVTAAQVVIAWTRARSPVVHPIIGARTVEQFEDNLGAADVVLPDEAVKRLTAAVDFDVGFPTDLIGQTETSSWAYGRAATRLDGRS